MTAETAFLLSVVALVACQLVARLEVDAEPFDDLPHPHQID